MKPKEKAKEVYIKYYNKIQATAEELGMDLIVSYLAKDCAILAIDEVISYMTPQTDSKEAFDYWRKVIKQIEKL